MGGGYELKSHLTFARQLCDDTCLPGWLLAFPAQIFKPTSANFTDTQIANHLIQPARKPFWRFF